MNFLIVIENKKNKTTDEPNSNPNPEVIFCEHLKFDTFKTPVLEYRSR